GSGARAGSTRTTCTVSAGTVGSRSSTYSTPGATARQTGDGGVPASATPPRARTQSCGTTRVLIDLVLVPRAATRSSFGSGQALLELVAERVDRALQRRGRRARAAQRLHVR